MSTMRTNHHSTLALLVVSTVLSWGMAAHAEGTAAAADTLFDRGRDALAKGDLDTACASFRASDQLEAAAGTRLNLGDCEERRGKVASAWEAFRATLPKLPPGDPRIAIAEARIRNLEHRLPRLTLTLAPGVPRDTIVREGDVTIGAAATFGIALPLDPGMHHLNVLAPGRAPRSLDVMLLEGKTVALAVEPETAQPVERVIAHQTSTPWILGGVGVAGLIVGGVTGAFVLQKKSVTNAHCSDATHTCDADGKAAADAGRMLGPVSTTGLVVGALGVSVGAIWLLARTTRGPSTAIGFGLIAGGGAWRMEGTW